MKNKKGFTLIELIAAIAILTIAFMGITLAITYSIKTEKKSNVKLDTSFYVKGIVEMIRSQGGIKSEKYCIYFDDMYDDTDTTNVKGHLKKSFYDHYVNGVDGTDVRMGVELADKVPTSVEYRSLKDNNTNKRGYCCVINIAPEGAKIFKIKLWVLDLNYENKNSIYREFYLSRW